MLTEAAWFKHMFPLDYLKILMIWVISTPTLVFQKITEPVARMNDQGSFLWWLNFNSSMNKQLHGKWNVESNYVSIPKLQLLHRSSFGMDK